MPEIKIIAENLKILRKEKDETQMNFAANCGISTEALSLLERQKSDPKLSTLQKVATYGNVTVSELLDTEKPLPIRKDEKKK